MKFIIVLHCFPAALRPTGAGKRHPTVRIKNQVEKVVSLSEVGGKRVTMNQMFFTQLRLCMLLNLHTLPPAVRPEVMIYVERKVRLYTKVLHGGQGHLWTDVMAGTAACVGTWVSIKQMLQTRRGLHVTSSLSWLNAAISVEGAPACELDSRSPAFTLLPWHC